MPTRPLLFGVGVVLLSALLSESYFGCSLSFHIFFRDSEVVSIFIMDRLLSQFAGLAHLVERHLAKVEVASSSLVARSIKEETIV